ncbi:MAG: SRPBCC family protein [Bacteroidota bacterium]
MKYQVEVIIDRPRNEVIQLFDSTEHMHQWMEGLLEFEHLSGTPGEVGAKSKMRFQMGKRDMTLIETITTRNLPDELSGTYEAPGAFNIVNNYFEALNEHQTRYMVVQEFKFDSFGMKLLSALLPGMFKKQSLKNMNAFKAYAERTNL